MPFKTSNAYKDHVMFKKGMVFVKGNHCVIRAL